LLEPGSFDAYKNVTVLIIVMLGYSEIDTEVLDVDMETTESDDCREVSKNDNGVLAMMQEGVRYSCKDGQKFIDLFA